MHVEHVERDLSRPLKQKQDRRLVHGPATDVLKARGAFASIVCDFY